MTRRISELDLCDASFIVLSRPLDLSARATLTRTELLVLDGVVAGFTDAEIARRRSVSRRTVSKHVEVILRKLGASSRVDLVVKT